MANFYKNNSSADASGAVNYAIQDVALAQGLGRLVSDLVVARLVTNYSAEARAQGSRFASKVRVPKRGEVASTAKTPGTAATPAAAVMTKGEIEINKHRTWDILVEDYGSLFTGGDLLTGYLVDGAGKIAEDIETDVIASIYQNASRILGAPQGGMSVSLIRTARKHSRNDKWSQSSPSYMIHGPEAEADLLAEALFVQADQAGTTEALVNARLGRKFGFEHYTSNLLPVIAGSPGAEHGIAFQSESNGIAFIDLNEADMPAEFQNTGVFKRAMTLDDNEGNPVYGMRMIVGYSQLDRGYVLTVDSIYGVGAVRTEKAYDILV